MCACMYWLPLRLCQIGSPDRPPISPSSFSSAMHVPRPLQSDRQAETESMVMRLDGLILGGDDLAADIGAVRTRSAHELLFVSPHHSL